MLNEKKLKNYILGRFALTLVVVGLFQLFGNVIFMNVINPLLGAILKIDFLSSVGFTEGLTFIIVFFIALVASPGAALKVGQIIGKIFNIDVNDQVTYIIDTSFERFKDAESYFYLAVVILCIIVMLILWVLPYVVGGIIFTTSVSKKVKELEKQRVDKEQEEERQKNLLLSDVAHDIKTPITTIAGFSQALSEGNVSEDKKQEYLEAIKNKSMQTVDMVTLLFEYVKLDSEGYQLNKTTEDVCEIFRDSIASYYTDFEDKDMELDIDIPEEGIFLHVDRLQLQRVFNNILVNACKHNDAGTKLTLSIELLDKWVSVKISDNGNWIESETARHIFDPFVQGDKSRTGRRGTGLGLSITRKIVEMHEGRIRLIQYKAKTPFVKTFEIQLKREDNVV